MSRKLVDAVVDAERALGLVDKFPTLKSNAKLSEAIVKDSRQFLRSQVSPRDVPFDVLALGSVARQESSAESDFDYLIVAHELPSKVTQSRRLRAAVEDLRDKLHLKAPGRTGVFGRVVSAPDLTEFIGLEDDTNRSLTHRILILGESVSIYQPDRHKLLIRRILERYLADYKTPKPGVPRFLLNDVLRYWRTLAVDYQAKRWGQVEPEWGLRYLKLLISRKLAFASFLIPLLLCNKATVRYFVDQFSMPPLARITQLYKFDKAFHRPLRTILEVAEEFAQLLADKGFRNEAEKVVAPGDKNKWPKRFQRARQLAGKLQEALENVFFNSALLCKISKRYLSF